MPTDLTRLQSNQPVILTDGSNSAGVTAGGLVKVDASGATVNVVLQTGSALAGGVEIYDGAGTNKLTVAATGEAAVNVARINGVVALMGNGTTGTGSQRVTIASDNTAFAVNATLQAAASTIVGQVKLVDSAGTNLLAIDASGRLSILGITNALPTGSNTIGTVNLGTGQPDVTQAVSISANTTGSTALSMSGMQGAGFFLNAIGTGGVVKPQISMDGGTTWTDTVFIAPSTGATSATAGSATTNQIIANTGGASHVRVFTTALTSGTLTGTLRATETQSGGALNSSAISSALPAGSNLIGGVEIYDGAGTNKLTVLSTGEANTNLTRVGGAALALGQTAMATSLPVVIANNQSNVPTNVAQINAVTPLMGNGITGTGSQRVTIASDNTAFAVNATLSAETTKVIGTVNQGTSPWVNNTSQINGVTVLMGNGTTGTGSQRVTIASDNTAFAVNATLQAAASTIVGQVKLVDSAGTNIGAVTASGALKIDLSATAANATAVKVDGSAVTQPVSFGETTTGIVNAYVASASTASAATANNDYTVTAGKTLYVKTILVSASAGPCKFDIINDPAGGNTTLATLFISSAAPAFLITFSQPPAIAATKVIRVLCTNSASASQSMYSTVQGHEI